METTTQTQVRQRSSRRGSSLATYILCLIILIAMIFLSNNGVAAKNNAPDANKRFLEYSYYKPEKLKRYSDFKLKNPVIRNADVVWMVNINMDNANYENTELVSDPGDSLVLVNKHYMLPISYEPEKLKSVGNDQKMAPEAADALNSMLADAKESGMEIIPQSGYRSYKLQSTIYSENLGNDPNEVDTYSARPGYSEHQTGLAVDLNVPYGGSLRDFVNTKEADWVAKNAYKYGFIVRYTNRNTSFTGYMPEPWHVRYIGADHAEKMKDKDIRSFEEYTAKYLDQDDKK